MSTKAKGSQEGEICGSLRATFTLNVISSMTYTRSGNALATSSTLLKYCTGSFISRSCSSNLNWPKIHNKGKSCETLTLDSCHQGDSIPSPYSHLVRQRLPSITLKKESHCGRSFSLNQDIYLKISLKMIANVQFLFIFFAYIQGLFPEDQHQIG